VALAGRCQGSHQSFDNSVQCWHSGDESKGTGNLQSIANEICVNSDGELKKAVENVAELTRHIMQAENIPIQNVVQHNKWSGKDCPHNSRNGEKV
jgi:N-acetylmuramoyl-L-alanine amidase CwlA